MSNPDLLQGTPTIRLTIDGHTVIVPQGATLMEAARLLDETVPTICYHEHTTSNGLCRLCVVEVEGSRVLAPACITQAREGMAVHTRSPRVERSRKTILEMLASSIDLSDAPEIQGFIDKYGADRERFPAAQGRLPLPLDDNPMYVRDYSKCVLCWRCVQVCAEDAQYTYAIDFTGRGYQTQIGTFFDREIPATTCVFCGQCIGVCPTGALVPKREWLLDQGMSPADMNQATQTGRRRRSNKQDKS